MSEAPSERNEEIQSSAQVVESSLFINEKVGDESLDLQEESKEKPDQLKDELTQTTLTDDNSATDNSENEAKPEVPTDDNSATEKPENKAKPESDAEPEVPIAALESLSIAEESPTAESLKSEERGRQTKPKSETPNKSRSRARSIADGFESPYNTRLKVKLMKEKEQRSLSEDSRKRDAKQTI